MATEEEETQITQSLTTLGEQSEQEEAGNHVVICIFCVSLMDTGEYSATAVFKYSGVPHFGGIWSRNDDDDFGDITD